MNEDKRIPISESVADIGCGCQPVGCNQSRRSLLKMAAVGVAVGLSGSGSALVSAAVESGEQSARPKAGDRLVLAKSASDAKPLRIEDIAMESPTLVYPLEPQGEVVRSGSRFNKVVLLRFNEAELPEEVAANAAGGVLAFSSVCTHQGCDVTAWMGSDRLLACFCHGSMFRPLEGGSVAAGPAPRALPVLPLAEKDGFITVAREFSAPPGF